VEQHQVEVAQPQALPADVESILQPISADHHQAQPTAEPVAQPVVAQPAPQPVVPPTPAEPYQVPLHLLIEERKERQAAQAQLRQERQELEAKIRQHFEAQQYASRPQPQPIDPVAEPERFAAAVQQELARKDQQMQSMAIHNRANTSEMLARDKHGDAAVETARDAAKAAGLGDYFLNQQLPYQELMKWHTSQTIAKEIGDPAAYKEKLKAEILAELAKGVAAPAARPGQPQILPPSLSSATRASATSPVVMDAGDFFKSQLFAKPQRT
jgi:hypothetical protein